MMVLDALGNFGNGLDSQIISSIENMGTALEVVTLTCFQLT